MAMVNMAQNFNTRYPLINGHGNFGSIDGDTPAAMRYTEVKLSIFGEQMLRDLHKNTVNFVPNFDESFEEPTVLPTMFPNLLANGSTGIAVSMATSIPPHNASSLYEAIKLILKNELAGIETTIDDLIAIVKAPDFPTGAEILDLSEVHRGYRTGKGKVMIRSKYNIEDCKGKEQIIITEIPYKVNKAELVANIDALRLSSLDEIKEVRDESDKDGIRVVVELKKDANANWVIKKLLKQTNLQTSFSMNMVALVNGRPQTFTLKEALEYFLAHIASLIMRRTQFDLDKAERRRHIVEGILICLDRIDEVIALIKASQNNTQMIANLMQEFCLSEEQAKNIADTRLRALSQASMEEIKQELEQLSANIIKWNGILNDRTMLLTTMQAEIEEISEIYKGERKTEIVDQSSAYSDDRELVKEEDLIITLTNNGIIKSVSSSEYAIKGRGTKGSRSAPIKDNDSIKFMLTLNSRDDLLFFTNKGRCHIIEAFKIPISGRSNVGKYINNYLNLESDEKIVSMLSKSISGNESDLIFITKNGVGKRLAFESLSSTRSVTKVITFKDSDELVAVEMIKKGQEIIIFSALGQSVRINPDGKGNKGIRPMGRTAAGVTMIKLSKNDYVVSLAVVNDSESLLLIAELGFGKRVKFDDFSTLSRGAKGVRGIVLNEKTGVLVRATTVSDSDDLFVATRNGLMSRISISNVRVMGRNASGVKIINLNDGDSVVSVSKNNVNEEEVA